MDGQELDRIDSKFDQMRNFFDETKVCSRMCHSGRSMRGKSLQMDFINAKLLDRNVRWRITLPVKAVVNDDALGNNVHVVPGVQRFVSFKGIRIVCQKKVIGITEFSGQRFRIWIDQQLMLVEPH